MRMLFLFLMACSPRPGLQATEAFDVPPPPGARTVRLTGDVPTDRPLGSVVTLRHGGSRTIGDLVDSEPGSLTLYVPEDRADHVLDDSGAVVIE